DPECRKQPSSTSTGRCWTQSICTPSPGTKRWRSSVTTSATSRREARSARAATSSFPCSSRPTNSGTTARKWRNGAASVSRRRTCPLCGRSPRSPIAAPSMKAALEAWGADSNLFHQGVAKESTDPEIVAATMKKPGGVLKRPVGTDRPFTENAELPTDLGGGGPTKAARKSKGPKAKQPSSRPVDKVAGRKAAF